MHQHFFNYSKRLIAINKLIFYNILDIHVNNMENVFIAIKLFDKQIIIGCCYFPIHVIEKLYLNYFFTINS